MARNRGTVATKKRKFWNYPRQGKGRIRRWLPSWRFVFGSIFLFLTLGIGLFTYLYVTTEVPEPDDFALAQTTTVYYADNETAMGSFADVRRTSVGLDTLPDYIPHAVVASEDQRFYENSGVDPIGIIRAAINNVRGGPRQGGSTLTQQYVERYYTGTTTSITGKARELVLALKIDKEQSKDEIMENYLNTIYFGRGAYGIEEAARAYFGISASELTLDQTALLVAVIPSPSKWDPAVDQDMATQRWARVIRRMAEDGWITSAEAQAATFPESIDPDRANEYEGPNGYLLQMVRDELVDTGEYTEDELDTSGLRIVTTIDPAMQEHAVTAVGMLPEDRPDNNQVGLVAIDPQTGEIKALYGGRDYVTRQRNSVTQDRAQAGSTAKPFALIAALEQDITLWDRYSSASPLEIDGAEFNNLSGYGHGNVTLIEATAQSYNTPFIRLNDEIGPASTREAMITAGFPEDTPGLEDNLGNVLGSFSPRAIDMARAYSTIAAQGEKTTPHIVKEVHSADGNVVYRGPTVAERVFDANDMANVTYALEQVVQPYATGYKAVSLGRPAAGKTGTSSYYTSAWFAGYVPQLVTVVNMYQVGPNGEEEPLTPFGGVENVGGSSFPAQLWTDFMVLATEGMDVEEFPEPQRSVVQAPPPPPEPEPTEEETTEEPTEEPTEDPTTAEPTEETTQAPPSESDQNNGQTDPPSDQQGPPGGGENQTPVEPTPTEER